MKVSVSQKKYLKEKKTYLKTSYPMIKFNIVFFITVCEYGSKLLNIFDLKVSSNEWKRCKGKGQKFSGGRR